MFDFGELESGWDHRAFVAGATGFVGRILVELLMEHCVETIAHIRPDQSEIDSWVNHFHSVGATIDLTSWEQVEMSNTLARIKPTIVFALLGSHKSRMRTKRNRRPNPFVDSYEAVDYGLNVMVARAAASAGSNPRLVNISSVHAKEKTGNDFYKARWQTEKFIQKTRLPYTIVRSPAIKNGGRTDNRSKKEDVKIMLKDGVYALAGIGGAAETQKRYTSISNEEIAETLFKAAFSPNCKDRILLPEEYRY